jgi:hypothetical protein|tara:strand:+ start:2071 stop:2370 length:300 start_codon:yes stop_codon:yes gene_type:complete
MKKTSEKNMNRPEWARKVPRSSRICFRCGHKYSSHVPSCRKIVERKPERKECDCRTFVKDDVEFDIVLRQEAGEDRRRAEWEKEREIEKNALIEKKRTS